MNVTRNVLLEKITVISTKKFYYLNWNNRSKQPKSVYQNFQNFDPKLRVWLSVTFDCFNQTFF